MKLSREERKRLALTRELVSREDRSAIVAGSWPTLEWEGETCAVEPGQTLDITARVSIEILRVTRRKDAWRATYRKIDMRAEPYLASAQPSVQDSLDRKSWSFDQEHGYTGSPRSGLGDAGRAVPRHFQARITAEKQAENAIAQERQRVRGEKIRLERRLRDSLMKGRSRTVRTLRRRLDNADRSLDEAA